MKTCAQWGKSRFPQLPSPPPYFFTGSLQECFRQVLGVQTQGNLFLFGMWQREFPLAGALSRLRVL
jgi:hypothetical protein